jgi:hypothetical protein
MAKEAENADGEKRPECIGARCVNLPWTILISIYVVIVSVALVYVIATLWPDGAVAGGKKSVYGAWSFLWWDFTVSEEVRLLLIVAFIGALGAQLRTLRSLTKYVGNRKLVYSWLLQYILTPFIGATLAMLLYFVIRGGFFSGEAGTEQMSLFGFAGLAGLAGFASEQAVLKLLAVAGTLFIEAPEGKESIPQVVTETLFKKPPEGGDSIPQVAAETKPAVVKGKKEVKKEK